MAVEDFLNGAMREVTAGNDPVAMACVCTVVDSLGKAEFAGRTRSRCLAFVDRYLDIVTAIGFGGAIRAQPGGTMNVLDPLDTTKTKNVTEVVYDIFYGRENRCEHGQNCMAGGSFPINQLMGDAAAVRSHLGL